MLRVRTRRLGTWNQTATRYPPAGRVTMTRRPISCLCVPNLWLDKRGLLRQKIPSRSADRPAFQAKSRIVQLAPETKVFRFFSSEKLNTGRRDELRNAYASYGGSATLSGQVPDPSARCMDMTGGLGGPARFPQSELLTIATTLLSLKKKKQKDFYYWWCFAIRSG